MSRLPQGRKPAYLAAVTARLKSSPSRGLLCLIFLIAAMLPAQQGPPTATIGPAPVQIAPPRPNYPFPDWQSYVYSAEWHLITAGTAVVKMEAAGNERKVTAAAESSGAVNVIFPVHDHFESRFDPRTFCSLSILKHSEEGSHKRETSIHFDYARKKSALDEKNLKTGETKHVENDLAACATDVITGFYYLQSLPLQLGASYEFPISDGKTTIVHATVEKRELIRVPAGTFRPCWLRLRLPPARCSRRAKFGSGIRRIRVTLRCKCASSWDGARCCFAC